ncbi:MAG: ribonuclease Y [Bdellovibrionales bacterium]
MTELLIGGGMAAGGLVAGVLGSAFFVKLSNSKKKSFAEKEAEKIVVKAKKEAERVTRSAANKAKDVEAKVKRKAEQEIQNERKNIQKEKDSLKDKAKNIESKSQKEKDAIAAEMRKIKDREEKIEIAQKKIEEQDAKKKEIELELRDKLEKVAQFSKDEAKEELLKVVKSESEIEASKLATRIEDQAKNNAEAEAKRLISMAISRYSGEYVVERSVSVVALPNEEMKGKIIGREGRNIRALETACGVDLIIDDTPEAVVISGFDPVRREIARRTLEKLIEDGRIHPSRIEEILTKEKQELFKSILADGEQACFDLGITGVHPEILKLIGSLRYRTSYTQNNYPHSIEVGFLAGMMASELDVDVKLARRSALLHDIGKTLDHSIAGSHAVIGADFAKKYGESEAVVHAIRAHHEDEKPRTVYAFLTQAADALSGARPGARRQMMEAYINRLEDLESIANSFDGVIRTFALQAGREIRVIVEGARVTDDQAVMLSRDIARKIERELTYPGQIKVSVIREIRAVDHAR